MKNKAIFLDRDGVINPLIYKSDEGVWDSPYRLEEFELFPGVPDAIKRINDSEFLAIIISNQPGIAKGKCDLNFIDSVNQKLKDEVSRTGGYFDSIRYCLHHPEGIVSPYGMVCDCRKPKPGLLLMAAQEYNIDLSSSYMIGDMSVDMEAGQSAGCATVFIPSKFGTQDEQGGRHMTATSLYDAVAKIL